MKKEIKMSTVRSHKYIDTPITLETYVKAIIDGEFKNKIDTLRMKKAMGNLQEANNMKKNLPAITPHGVFDIRADNKPPIEYSQLLAIDIDHLSEQKIDLIQFKKQLSNDQYVICAHKTCSGDGMAIFIKHSGEVDQHQEAVSQICDYIEHNYKVKVDIKVSKGINNQRFFSYDPDAFVNWNAKEFELIPQTEIEVIEDQIDYTNQKEKFEEGNRNQSLYQLACNCNRSSVPKEDLKTYASRYLQSSDFNMPEIIQTVNSAYKKNLNQIFEETIELDNSDLQEVEGGSDGQDGNVAYSVKNIKTALDFRGAPTLPGGLYDKLPKFLGAVANTGEDDVEKSLALLTALVGLSSIVPNVTLFYEHTHYPNLNIIVIANAGEGKSKVSNVKKLFDPLHMQFVDDCSKQKAVYNAEKQIFEICKDCKDAPLIPDCKGLYVPEDITHAALTAKLASTAPYNFLFSTEIDTFNRTAGSEMFDKTDILRKAFHHEPMSYGRKTGGEEKIILEPKLSILITGTPGAYEKMLKGVEDGTVSRFAYFGFGSDGFKWKSQQSAEKRKAAQDIEELSQVVLKIFDFIKNRSVTFDLTEDQDKAFNKYFANITSKLDVDKDQYYFASLKRHGLIFKRIAAVLTVVEAYETNNTSNTLICSDKTFGACFDIIGTLLEHSKIVYSNLEKRPYKQVNDKSEALYQALPDEFTPRLGYEIAKGKLGLTERTTRGYYAKLVKDNMIKKIGVKYQKTEMTSIATVAKLPNTVSENKFIDNLNN